MCSKKASKFALHSVKNLLGEPSQLDLFSNQAQIFSEIYNTPLTGKIDRFGIDLTDTQSRVMEGILRGFSESKYSHGLETKDREVFCEEKFSGKTPPAYKNIAKIPCLKTTQSQILSWAGIKKNSIAAWSRAVEAIGELGSKQFCFYYSRLAYDESGQPKKDKDGRWVKEEVYTVDTLFTIKKIQNSHDILEYYEIYPSSIFIDQLDTYFMYIPFNWREEVRALLGNKKTSSYTFRFLFYLRYEHEMFRRKNKSKPYILKRTPEEVAISIKMPENTYKRNPKKAYQILSDAYEAAKQLGYIISYERKEIDTFLLNDMKYNEPSDFKLCHGKPNTEDNNENKNAEDLLQLFCQLRKNFDKHYNEPSKKEFISHAKAFTQLLASRPIDDIKQTLHWAIDKKYWASFATTPLDFAKNFDKIWADRATTKQNSKEHRHDSNKAMAHLLLSKYDNQNLKGTTIHLLNQHLELCIGIHATIITYDDPEFQTKLREALKKLQIADIVKF